MSQGPHQTGAPEPANAVQAEPPALPVSAPTRDELLVPDSDIRLKQDRYWIGPCFLAGCIVISVAMVLALFTFGTTSVPQVDSPRIQTKALAQVCEAFKIKHGAYPRDLESLLQRDDFNVIWLDDPKKLIDPWGRPYQYNRKGPNNNGLHPDIWVVTPDDRRTIGNWPKMVKR